MPISHKKEFSIYHWDTFDNETDLVAEADTLAEAVEKVEKRYKGRIGDHGADQVDIVNRSGDIVRKFHIC